MERHLVDTAVNKHAEREEQLIKAADLLNAAAEICDESGLSKHAELITAVLESLAAKKKSKKKVKSKPKAKAKTKKPAPKLKKAPTSEKMVENLKEKGWMFDENGADDGAHSDENCVDDNCASCSDMSLVDDMYADPGDEDESLDEMLDDFKTSEESDFEDELDFGDDEDDLEVEIHDPFKDYKKIYID